MDICIYVCVYVYIHTCIFTYTLNCSELVLRV